MTNDKIDASTFSPLVKVSAGNTTGGNRTLVTASSYLFKANVSYLVMGNIQGDTVNGGSAVWEHRLIVGSNTIATSRAGAPAGAASAQRGASMQEIVRYATDTTANVTITTTLLTGTNTISIEIPRITIAPLITSA